MSRVNKEGFSEGLRPLSFQGSQMFKPPANDQPQRSSETADAADLQPLKSYCSDCDSEDPCDCGAPRYLDPVKYTKVEGGWRIDGAAERHRFYHPPKLPARAPAERKVKPIQQLVVELDAEDVLLEPPLEAELRVAYEGNPPRVNQIVDSVVQGARNGRLRNPAGLLYSKLREMVD